MGTLARPARPAQPGTSCWYTVFTSTYTVVRTVSTSDHWGASFGRPDSAASTVTETPFLFRVNLQQTLKCWRTTTGLKLHNHQ